MSGLGSARLEVVVDRELKGTLSSGQTFDIITADSCAGEFAEPVVFNDFWKGQVIYGPGTVTLTNLYWAFPGTVVLVR